MREFVRFFNDGLDSLVIADVKSFGDEGCDFTYYLPYPLAYGEFKSVLAYVPEEASNCFIIGETSGDGEDIVLHEDDRGVGNLCREITRLALAKPEILLAVLENHLDSPSHGVDSVGFEEIQGCVCGENAAPGSPLATAHIEYSDWNVVKERVHDNIIASMLAAVLHAGFLSGALGNDCLGGHLVAISLEGETHCLLAHLYHSEVVALDVARLDELDNLLAGEPTVGQQIVKTTAVGYDTPYHFLEQVDLASGVVCHPFGRCALFISLFTEASFELRLAHGMIAFLAGFAYDLKVKHHLALAVTYGQGQSLESEYHLVGHMAEYATNVLCMDAAFWVVSVIHYQTHRVASMVGPSADTPPKLAGDMGHNLAPIQRVVIYESVEDIFRCTA